MDVLSYFSETLSSLIFDKKISTEEFANAVGIDVSVVYRYLRKENIPTLPNAIIVADFFSCSLDFLLGLAPEDSTKSFKSICSFSERFKEILVNKGFSRYRLCKEAKISDQRVDDWFHGKRVPTIESCINLAKFFDCSLDYLVGRD